MQFYAGPAKRVSPGKFASHTSIFHLHISQSLSIAVCRVFARDAAARQAALEARLCAIYTFLSRLEARDALTLVFPPPLPQHSPPREAQYTGQARYRRW
jgi:hypothetical protein